MRKIMVLVIAALLIVPGAVALAGETTVYDVHNNPTPLARAYLSDCYNTDCNATPRVITVNISASIAQWAKVSLNATKIEWYVLKPGEYYIDGIKARLQSNGNLYVDYEGFEDLVNDDGDVLETYYALAPGDWISASALNAHDDPIPENDSHDEVEFTLYNKIVVMDCDSACEYADPKGATISVILAEQKPWVAY